MKFSEMNTQQAAQVMCDIAVPIANIAQDENLAPALASFTPESTANKPFVSVIGAAVAKIVPIVMKDHFEDLCAIMAHMTGKTVQQIKEQKILQTVEDAKNIIDEDLMHFFTFAGKSTQEKSSAPQPVPSEA